MPDRSEQRADLIEATGRLLRDRGLQGVSLRRVAEACDVSTQMIYTLFGGKPGLLRAVWDEGFERLADTLEEVGDDLPPRDRLRRLGQAYRRFALAHPELYEAMFARSLEEFRPASADVERDTRAFAILLECVEDCLEAGHFAGLEARAVADALWAAVHGAAELELSGFYEDDERAERQFELVLSSIGLGLAAGPPADPDDDT